RLNLDAMPVIAAEPDAETLFQRGRQRAFVKVQDGCRYRCGFCIVTVARGEERSRALPEVIDEINRITAAGIQEVVLTGVHLGGYGADQGSSLTELVKTVLNHTDVQRLRLGSLEPWAVGDDFFALFDDSRLMPHLHLPLQSGADSVLRRMTRRGKVREFMALAAELRNRHPGFNITSDIIVGFPGETEQEWQQTLDCVTQVGFGDLHIFGYSKRPGTKAAALPDQLPNPVIKQRSGQLHALAKQVRADFWQSHLGQTLPVLWEGVTQPGGNGESLRFGYTPNYIRVAVNADKAIDSNQIRPVVLTESYDTYVLTQLNGSSPP
ncbi:MAG: MiaB/RimO family radical SAM methylthiotransferase, partial [Methylococcales bacterium]|nr:MiaB/RimO family radical SAM methylthiotransferase [Methylococcales bacterium]